MAVLVTGVVLGTMADAARAQVDGPSGEAPRFLMALNVGAAPVEVDVAAIPHMRRRVDLEAMDTPLTELLAEIARQADVQFVYDPAVPRLDRRVTLEARGITVAAALTELLLDQRLDVLMSHTGQATLVPRPPRPEPPTGTITGQVTDSASSEPIAAAQVFIAGSELGSLTDANGRYSIAGVPGGEHEVRAQSLGYREQSQIVSAPVSGTVTVDFALVLEPARMDELVVTVTGEQRRAEIGNVIETVDVWRTSSPRPR